MSDVLEPWSHPWHALQRTLAKAFGPEAGAYLQAAGARWTGAELRAADAANWLMRARTSASSSATVSTTR